MSDTVWCPICCQEATFTVNYDAPYNFYSCDNCDNEIPSLHIVIRAEQIEKLQMAPGGIFFRKSTQ